ncbi:NAD(P)-dependent dehydrogenase, short-chain alcohol dehydrogenase family [Chryseobacterium soldanellicola]|uniref:NAD(P)-dependent dehydrogenase, short-chain alcohol dehydrogenase family n=1 Tax=Chryseobacterium soldanellicola TaxID=311333 RepID=A0A1H1G8Y4_9FLAO|nr:SDR family oxidoreductase [Chryseobacterium soldanellicola]SDR09545.1 NAD(P)-dependent dehydrogenase, short-chain alcohol dehydrogenase family [Chryseobacterium soldanellicola]
METFKNKKVVILGASSGLGLATAKAAAEEGANLVIVSSNQERIDDALKNLPKGTEGYAIDLSKEENIRLLFENIGKFDHLVYTAGENLNLSSLSETDLQKARDFFTLRYWGAIAAIKYAAPNMNEGGSINLTSGIANQRPGAGWALASSICGAMDGLCRAMAVELAPIRVNAVAPGVIRTNLWNGMSEEKKNDFYKNVGDSLLVKRVGEAEEIAQSFIFLMKQAFVTGQIITIDGGTVLV